MNILLVGADGQLGRTLRGLLDADSHRTVAPDRKELDFTHPIDTVAAVVRKARPDWVINCAAMTDVDRCEAEPELALRLNARAPAALAAAAAASGARMLHVSTDYVFSGEASRPYSEDDSTGPLGIYGRTKLAGEQAVAAAAPDALIVRTAWLYSVHGRNFFKTMLRLFAGGGPLRVVDDQVGSPTAAPDLARALIALMKAGARGVYHATNRGQCSWHGFATAIRDEAVAVGAIDNRVVIEPVTTEEFPRPAPRPAYSVLDTARLTATTGVPPRDWRVALRDVVAEWHRAA